jgi:hypothetical protein
MCYDVALKADAIDLLDFYPDLFYDFNPHPDFQPRIIFRE